jgi:predicted membrane protein
MFSLCFFFTKVFFLVCAYLFLSAQDPWCKSRHIFAIFSSTALFVSFILCWQGHTVLCVLYRHFFFLKRIQKFQIIKKNKLNKLDDVWCGLSKILIRKVGESFHSLTMLCEPGRRRRRFKGARVIFKFPRQTSPISIIIIRLTKP